MAGLLQFLHLNNELLCTPMHFQPVSSTLGTLPCQLKQGEHAEAVWLTQELRKPLCSYIPSHSKSFNKPIASRLIAIAMWEHDVVAGNHSLLLGIPGWG